MTLTITNLNEIENTAKAFVKAVRQQSNANIIAFYGNMGVGKTTFIKAVCKVLGVEDEVSSPTFALINEYFTKEGKSIYHFDFYRIESIDEAYDFGYEDYFFSNKLCLIEWPELMEPLLPEQYIKVEISENDDFSRALNVSFD